MSREWIIDPISLGVCPSTIPIDIYCYGSHALCTITIRNSWSILIFLLASNFITCSLESQKVVGIFLVWPWYSNMLCFKMLFTVCSDRMVFMGQNGHRGNRWPGRKDSWFFPYFRKLFCFIAFSLQPLILLGSGGIYFCWSYSWARFSTV